jgi:hypothetical protein
MIHRPANPSSTKNDLEGKNIEYLSAVYKSYEKLRDHYMSSEMTQSSHHLLVQITKNEKIPFEVKLLPLLRFLIETSQEFFLGELEIIMWSLLLEEVVWENLNRNLQVLLLFSAYFAKNSMNFSEDMAGINSFLKCKYKGFFTGYEKWHNEHSHKLYVQPRAFNRYLKRFGQMKVVDWTNYNYYVDQILWMAPPNSPDVEMELLFDDAEVGDRNIPELMNLNSVLEEDGISLPLLESWISQDVMKDLELES